MPDGTYALWMLSSEYVLRSTVIGLTTLFSTAIVKLYNHFD